MSVEPPFSQSQKDLVRKADAAYARGEHELAASLYTALAKEFLAHLTDRRVNVVKAVAMLDLAQRLEANDERVALLADAKAELER